MGELSNLVGGFVEKAVQPFSTGGDRKVASAVGSEAPKAIDTTDSLTSGMSKILASARTYIADTVNRNTPATFKDVTWDAAPKAGNLGGDVLAIDPKNQALLHNRVQLSMRPYGNTVVMGEGDLHITGMGNQLEDWKASEQPPLPGSPEAMAEFYKQEGAMNADPKFQEDGPRPGSPEWAQNQAGAQYLKQQQALYNYSEYHGTSGMNTGS